MVIEFSVVGQVGNYDNVKVDLPAVPREGEVVNLPGLEQHETMVRTVVWYPTHDDEDQPLDEPFVYIVVGPPRPH